MDYLIFHIEAKGDQENLNDHLQALRSGRTCSPDCWDTADSIYSAVDKARKLGTDKAIIVTDGGNYEVIK